MFSGLRSRWTMCCACAAASELAIWPAHAAARRTTGQRAELGEPRVERLALEELHHDERAAVGVVAEVEDLHDPGIADRRHRARLVEEPVDDVGPRATATASSTLIAARRPSSVCCAEVHRAHPALAELADDLVVPDDSAYHGLPAHPCPPCMLQDGARMATPLAPSPQQDRHRARRLSFANRRPAANARRGAAVADPNPRRPFTCRSCRSPDIDRQAEHFVPGRIVTVVPPLASPFEPITSTIPGRTVPIRNSPLRIGVAFGGDPSVRTMTCAPGTRCPVASRTVPPTSAPRARSSRTSRTDVPPGECEASTSSSRASGR